MRGIPKSSYQTKLPKYKNVKPISSEEAEYQSYQSILTRTWQSQYFELTQKCSIFDQVIIQKNKKQFSDAFYEQLLEKNGHISKQNFTSFNCFNKTNNPKLNIAMIIQRVKRLLDIKPPVKTNFIQQLNVLRSVDAIFCASAVEKIQTLYISLQLEDAKFLRYMQHLIQQNSARNRNQVFQFLDQLKIEYSNLYKHLTECILDIQIVDYLKNLF